jgi:hypothetical protein
MQEPAAQESAETPAPAEGQGQPAAGGKPDPIKDMVISIDQGITQVANVLGKQSPDLGQALAQLGEQFRQIITSAMSGGQAPQSGGKQPAQAGVPMEQGKSEAVPY